MAVKLSSDAQLVFFTKVFGQHHPVVEHVKALLSVGVTFEVSLYAVRAFTNEGKKPLEPVQLSYGTTALMKGTVEPAVYAHNKKLIEDWVSYLHAKQGSPKPVFSLPTKTVLAATEVNVVLAGVVAGKKLLLIKTIMNAIGGTVAGAKAIVDAASGGTPTKVFTYLSQAEAMKTAQAIQAAGGTVEVIEGKTAAAKVGIDWATGVPLKDLDIAFIGPKPVDKVIDLKNSLALGQKVHGTSTGSVYHTIALTDHLKVAARISGGTSISLRAEWTDNPKDDLKKLQEAGVVLKEQYASVHFDAAGVPIQRVIGAFLMGTGIVWKHVISNGSEIVVG